MELSSFEFGLHVFLPIYSRTTVTEEYSIFTVLEEDVYELGAMFRDLSVLLQTNFEK